MVGHHLRGLQGLSLDAAEDSVHAAYPGLTEHQRYPPEPMDDNRQSDTGTDGSITTAWLWAMALHDIGTVAKLLCAPFHASHWAAILYLHPNCEIESIDVECNIQIAWMVRVQRIMETRYFATSQNHLAHGFGVAWSALQDVAQVQGAHLILVGSHHCVVSHCHQANQLRAMRSE